MESIVEILHPFKASLGIAYVPYLHHACRVKKYACHLLSITESDLITVTAAFHDLDVWENETMDYLEGSSRLAKRYVIDHTLDIDLTELDKVITLHHQLVKIRNHPTAEAFRKADLIDLSAGLINLGLTRSLIRQTEKHYPRHGFTQLIMKKVISWSARNPTNPFPMIKW